MSHQTAQILWLSSWPHGRHPLGMRLSSWVGIAAVLEVAHSWLALVLALAAFAVLLWRPRINPLILLATGALIAISVDVLNKYTTYT